MRKLPPEKENPIDNLIYILIEKIAPFVYLRLGFSANIITTIRLILGALSIYFIYQYQFILSSLFWALSYFADCLDGYVARKYNHATIFGDYYDHITDYLLLGILIFCLYNINSPLFITIVPYIFIIIILVIGFVTCQEIIHGGNKSPMLSIFKYMFFFINKSNANSYLNFFKYFGCGTQTLFFCVIILYYGYVYYKSSPTTDKNGVETDETIGNGEDFGQI